MIGRYRVFVSPSTSLGSATHGRRVRVCLSESLEVLIQEVICDKEAQIHICRTIIGFF